LTPNVNIKTDAASTQLDVNLTYMYKNTFWVGATYRMQDAIAPMLGYKFQKGTVRGLKIGYSYDVTTSTLKGHSSGSHEIMLGYCFKNEKPKPVSTYGNTRFLD
jgi:type IX secretion system PorP/SprF family membrane protein